MHRPPELFFQPGLVVDEVFTDYKAFQRGAKNHLILSRYRLGSGPFYGIHNGIQLYDMQFGFADRHEGVLSDGVTPKGCVTFAAIQYAAGPVSINRFSLKEGDVIVLDDLKPYRFASGGRARMAIVSVRQPLFSAYGLTIPDRLPAIYHDDNAAFSNTVDRLWSEGKAWQPGEAAPTRLEAMEAEVMQALAGIVHTPPRPETVCSVGNAAAFDARDYLLEYLEEIDTVRRLAEHFDVSYRTLETSFRTLFGMTPKQLMEILRLNHAHDALCRSEAATTSVAAIAMDWGFKHLGRFAERHKAMFGTYPKEALLSDPFETLSL